MPSARSRRCARIATALSAIAISLCAAGPRLAMRPARAQGLSNRLGPAAWIARYSSPDPVVRRGVLYLLGRFAPPPVPLRQRTNYGDEIARLIEHETDASVLLAAVGALATGRFPNAATRLQGIVVRPQAVPPQVQAAALRALGVLLSEGAMASPIQVDQVRALLLRPPVQSPEAIDAAARGLAALPEAHFQALFAARPEAQAAPAASPQARGANAQTLGVLMHGSTGTAQLLRAIGHRGDPTFGAYVIAQISARSWLVQQAAIEAALRLHLVEAVAALSEIARDPNVRHEVRRDAIRALGSLGGPTDAALLREALGQPLTRDAALAAIVDLGDQAYSRDVARLLGASWPVDRRSAAEVLGSLGGSEALAALGAQLAREQDPPTRVALWHALARAGGAAAWRAVAAATPREAGARWAATEMILRGEGGSLSTEAIAPAVTRRDPSALVLAGALGVSGRALIDALNAPESDVRAAAAVGLSHSRALATGAADALVARLSREDDEGVRAALVLALGAAEGTLPPAVLIELLTREVRTPSGAALAAADVVGRQGLRAALSALRTMAEAADPLARAIALRALGRLRDEGARTVLESALRFDPDDGVRGVAAMALADLLGAGALPEIASLARVAWTPRLADLVSQAQRVARSERPARAFHGPAVVRVSGAQPRSLWALALPDGGFALGVSVEGEVMIPGAPALDAPLLRVYPP